MRKPRIPHFFIENCFFMFLQLRLFISKSSHFDPFSLIFPCLQIFSKKAGFKSQIDHSSVFLSYLPEKTRPGDLQNDVFFDDFWHLPARRLLKVARVSQRATNRTPKVDRLVTRWLLKVARVSQRASNRTLKVDQPLTKLAKSAQGEATRSNCMVSVVPGCSVPQKVTELLPRWHQGY